MKDIIKNKKGDVCYMFRYTDILTDTKYKDVESIRDIINSTEDTLSIKIEKDRHKQYHKFQQGDNIVITSPSGLVVAFLNITNEFICYESYYYNFEKLDIDYNNYTVVDMDTALSEMSPIIFESVSKIFYEKDINKNDYQDLYKKYTVIVSEYLIDEGRYCAASIDRGYGKMIINYCKTNQKITKIDIIREYVTRYKKGLELSSDFINKIYNSTDKDGVVKYLIQKEIYENLYNNPPTKIMKKSIDIQKAMECVDVGERLMILSYYNYINPKKDCYVQLEHYNLQGRQLKAPGCASFYVENITRIIRENGDIIFEGECL